MFSTLVKFISYCRLNARMSADATGWRDSHVNSGMALSRMTRSASTHGA